MAPGDFSQILTRAEIVPFFLMGLAVICGAALLFVTSLLRHRERMALIRKGIHPDQAPAAEEQVKEGVHKTKEKTVAAAKETAWRDWTPPEN